MTEENKQPISALKNGGGISNRCKERIEAGGIEVTQASIDSGTRIRVFKSGVLIAEEFVTKRGGMKYLKTLTRSKHFLNLERQLLPHRVTLQDIGL